MAIAAVSSYSNNTYVYSSNVEYSYFGATISGKELQDLMEKYGIQQSGDSEKDLRALYSAMYADATNQVKESQSSSTTNNSQQPQSTSQATDAGNSTNVPWANLMSQVGLYVTGDLETDYNAFSNKISAMQASGATSPNDEATINQLIAQASIVFVQQSDSSTQATAGSAQGSQATSQPTGADIVAQLNKMLISAS